MQIEIVIVTVMIRTKAFSLTDLLLATRDLIGVRFF